MRLCNDGSVGAVAGRVKRLGKVGKISMRGHAQLAVYHVSQEVYVVWPVSREHATTLWHVDSKGEALSCG